MSCKELHIVSSAHLPIILAQHLFTSFMWTIAEKLPKGCLGQGQTRTADVKVDRGTFDEYDFRKTWFRPNLSNSRLDTFVKYAEAAGLGSRDEILLCMVPALSFSDLLPSEKILSLMPHDYRQIERSEWARTARFYRNLLDSSIGAEIEEYFALTMVVRAMEFVYLASEPFTKNIEPEDELRKELSGIVRILTHRFRVILSSLWPVYDLQQRRETFGQVFHSYMINDDIPELEFPRLDFGETGERQVQFLKRIGFTRIHLRVCERQIGQPNRHFENWLFFRDVNGKWSLNPPFLMFFVGKVLTNEQWKTLRRLISSAGRPFTMRLLDRKCHCSTWS
jgi:hypothetical protein